MDNRATILRVALRLFATHGYEAVGVQQIVNEAGVTKPTLYHYFQSKKGLFDAILAEKSGLLLEGLAEASHYRGDIVLSITQVTRFYFGFLEREPLFYRLLLTSWFMPASSEIYPSVADLHTRQFALLETMFRQAVINHGNMRGRHTQYAVSLRGVIDTYVGLSMQGSIQLADEQMIYRIVHQFMHGIFS